MRYPVVRDEIETLRLLTQGFSIARYGDGELNLCIGGKAKAQEFDVRLAERLRAILHSPVSQCLVGIPRIADTSFMTKQKQQFWSRYQAEPYVGLYRHGGMYASAFITRPDSVPEINTAEYFASMQRLWRGRDVVLINGNQPGQRFDEHSAILNGVTSCRRWDASERNAWSGYPDLLERCRREPKETLFIISLGPTATVLAYDLASAGYQALDLGHLGMFFARMQ